jgi:1-deoxy-D-xylulose-5-phosphate synthase
MPEGRAQVVEPGSDVQIWALGDMGPAARKAALLLAETVLSAGVVNPRYIRPLDEDLLIRQSAGTRLFAILENGILTGGFGSLVEAALVRRGYTGRIVRFGWPDEFIPHGDPAYLFERYGLTAQAVAARIRKTWDEASA